MNKEGKKFMDKYVEVMNKSIEDKESEEFINEYNKRLRKFNFYVDDIYMKLEEKGIVILYNVKMEIESEVLDMDMEKDELENEICCYIKDIVLEYGKGIV